MKIGDRIKKVRLFLKLNQTDFGQKIGLSQTAIGLYENSARNIPDRTILLICQQYNVRQNWLETGEGEMFDKPVDDDLFAQFVRQHRLSDTSAAIMRSYVELPPEDRENLHRIIVQLLAPAFAQAVAPTGDSYRDAAIEKLRSDPEFQRAISESLTPPVPDEKNA